MTHYGRCRTRKLGPWDDAKHRPLHGFAFTQGLHFPVGRGPSRWPQGTVLTVPRAFAPPRARRDEGIPPYGRPGGRGHPFWPGVSRL